MTSVIAGAVVMLTYILLAVAYGLFMVGVHRKLVARMQNRKGPPVIQPFYDLLKLLGKENLSYRASSHEIWLEMALIAILLATLSVVPIKNGIYAPNSNIIWTVFLLSAAQLFIIFAALGSLSIFGEIGGIRALLQFVSYEGAFIISTLYPVYAVTGDFIIPFKTANPMLKLFPIMAAAFLIVMVAQLHMQPFNIPNAHQEIVAGYATEFSSIPYAIAEVVNALKLYTLTSIFTILYLNGPLSLTKFILTSLTIVFIISIIRTAIARTRITTAIKIYTALTLILAVYVVVRSYVWV